MPNKLNLFSIYLSKFKQHKILRLNYQRPRKLQVMNRKYLLMLLVKTFLSKALLRQWAAAISLLILINIKVEQSIYKQLKRQPINEPRLKVLKSY
jgi:hypothetical protein|nr:MAG TPA: hypothetical protein [Caudoviricetes sp.]